MSSHGRHVTKAFHSNSAYFASQLEAMPLIIPRLCSLVGCWRLHTGRPHFDGLPATTSASVTFCIGYFCIGYLNCIGYFHRDKRAGLCNNGRSGPHCRLELAAGSDLNVP